MIHFETTNGFVAVGKPAPFGTTPKQAVAMCRELEIAANDGFAVIAVENGARIVASGGGVVEREHGPYADELPEY